jgi:hypothetical protein
VWKNKSNKVEKIAINWKQQRGNGCLGFACRTGMQLGAQGVNPGSELSRGTGIADVGRADNRQ